MNKKTFQKPKGTNDILGNQTLKWSFIENTARNIFSKYQYSEIRTPIFEDYEIFARTSGETSDVVSKEMYDFYDKGNRHIALRPEGTAGVVRSFVENKLYAPEYKKPYKVFYIGPMFRYERPQAGRLRQFHQIGVEAFGIDSPILDAEMIIMALKFLNKLNINNLKVSINSLGDQQSRDNYKNSLINYLKPFYDDLSKDSQVRFEKNPLRILDSKDENDIKIIENAPSILNNLTKESKEHFEKVKFILDDLKIKYEVNKNIVRGLDYYNNTIFEISVKNNQTNELMTLIGGGRYSNMVEEFGGPKISGIGFGIGIERLITVIDNYDISNEIDVYIINNNENDENNIISILFNKIVDMGYSVSRDYQNKKFKKQIKEASNLNAKYIIIIGNEELENKKITLKNMITHEQIEINDDDIDYKLKEILSKKM